MIDWLIQRAADDPRVAAGLPPKGLLSGPETDAYNALHSAKRRKDWLLGRWTAKRMVQATIEKSGGCHPSFREISILAAKDGAPEVWLATGDNGKEGRLSRGDYNISISHSSDVSLCAIITPGTYLLGADIETIELRSDRFVEDYFTDEENSLVQQAPLESRECLITAIWSGKEAAFKAVRQGLRMDTRSVCCSFPSNSKRPQEWSPFTIRWSVSQEKSELPQLLGWWRVWQNFVLTLVITGEANCTQRRVGIRKRR